MSAPVFIDELGAEEWARFREVRLRALMEAPLAFGSTLEEERALPEADWPHQLSRAVTFVARCDGSRGPGGDVGVVRLAADRADPEVGWLIAMWVCPEARGCGVGDALVSAVLERARAVGYTRVRLDVADLNQDAVLLYARHGFTPTGEVGTHRPPREHIREHRREVVLAGR